MPPARDASDKTLAPANEDSDYQVDPQVLASMVCPLTRSPLRQEGQELLGEVGGLRYPIRQGIPIMLIDEAKMPAGIADLEDFKKRFAGQIPRAEPDEV